MRPQACSTVMEPGMKKKKSDPLRSRGRVREKWQTCDSQGGCRPVSHLPSSYNRHLQASWNLPRSKSATISSSQIRKTEMWEADFTLFELWLYVWYMLDSHLKEMGIPDHLTCLLRNLYAGQKATVRTGHGTTDCFQIRKGEHQGCILSHCLFNLYTGYIMRNAGLDIAQTGIKIARRHIK